jgi:anti-sigma B factor antagonist
MAANPVSPGPELEINTEKTPTEIILRYSGRITSSTYHRLESTVRDVIPDKKAILLDLSNVNYMDSFGLSALFGVWVSAKKQGCELKLISLSPRVAELLRITSLDKMFAASKYPDTPSYR